MACKGVCCRYKATKPISGGRYENGQKRCQVCELFVTWEGLWCPCCSYRLRGKPRNKVYKAKLRAKSVELGDSQVADIAEDVIDAVVETVQEDVVEPLKKLVK